MPTVKMSKLFNEKATYVAYGEPDTIGKTSEWTPGLSGSVFHHVNTSETLGKIGPNFLPKWLQARLDSEMSMPTHFDVFGMGQGEITADELFTIE